MSSDKLWSTERTNDSDPLGLVDYYSILGIKPGFSDVHLLHRFLKGCRQAMAIGNQEALMSIRRGFEVLRYEDTRIVYFRMHRVLVRHEPLRFPEAKKREMMQEIRTKEALALDGTSPVIKPRMGYGMLQLDVLMDIVLMDLSRVLGYGVSGTVFLIAMPIIIAVNGATSLTLGISAMFAAFAFIALKARASDYVTYPDMHPFRRNG